MEASSTVGPSNDELLAQQGVEIPGADAAAEVSPDAPPQVLATPDITKAQMIGAVPVIAKLLAAFHVYTLSADQQEALTLAVGGGVALWAADAVIRFGRSVNKQKA
jgi:hypothetical protein